VQWRADWDYEFDDLPDFAPLGEAAEPADCDAAFAEVSAYFENPH
jgi:hypothetical protein